MEINIKRLKRMRCSVIDEKPEDEEEDKEVDLEQKELEEEQKRYIRRIKTLKVLGLDSKPP